MQNEVFNAVIKPEDSNELLECGIGSVVTLGLIERLGRKFALNINYIEKVPKNIAA